MISPTAQIEEFLAAVTGNGIAEIVISAKTEKRAAEDLAKQQQLGAARDAWFEYTQLLHGLIFWLTSRSRPRNCKDFKLFRPLTESLVRSGTFGAELLMTFDR